MPKIWGKLNPIQFHEIDHAQLQFINIQAYFIIQFNQIMLQLIIPNFNPNFFMLDNSSDTIVEF